LRRTREELAILGSLEKFPLLIISLLPESWDNFTSVYLGASSNAPTILSHEFISLFFWRRIIGDLGRIGMEAQRCTDEQLRAMEKEERKEWNVTIARTTVTSPPPGLVH
jgi:hypothetical protein